MQPQGTARARLIAPCGMDCAICSAYLAYTNGIPKKRGAITHCSGCRDRPKHCAYLKAHCVPLSQGQVEYCYQCADYPCARLRHLDARYRQTYHMSMIENLAVIETSGVDAFIAQQQLVHACPHCGELRSIHNGKCFGCEPIASWR